MEIHRKDGEIENRPKSIGGKIFDLMTYVGIAGVGTFFVTIPIANMFKRGHQFHGFDQAMRNGVRKLGAPENIVEQVANTTNTVHGGNLMLIPVGLMEYFRTPIVNGLNRLFNDPTDPKSVEDAPPQTASSIIKGRLTSWATVFAAFTGFSMLVGQERFKSGLDAAGKAWCKFRNKPVEVMSAHDGLIKSKWYNFGHTGALDALATASSASMLYVSSHAFAKRAVEKRAHTGSDERREAIARAKSKDAYATSTDDTGAMATEKPSTTISQVQRESSVNPASQEPVIAAL